MRRPCTRNFLMRSLLAGMAMVFLGAAALTASAKTLPNKPTYDEIIERGRLDVAVYESFPPFSYRQDGKLVGLDVDLARKIAEKLGVKASFRELPAGETVDDDLRRPRTQGVAPQDCALRANDRRHRPTPHCTADHTAGGEGS